MTQLGYGAHCLKWVLIVALLIFGLLCIQVISVPSVDVTDNVSWLKSRISFNLILQCHLIVALEPTRAIFKHYWSHFYWGISVDILLLVSNRYQASMLTCFRKLTIVGTVHLGQVETVCNVEVRESASLLADDAVYSPDNHYLVRLELCIFDMPRRVSLRVPEPPIHIR